MTHAEYMRKWRRDRREHLNAIVQERIRQHLGAEPSERPCSGCGRSIVLTASRKANRCYRCFACKQATRKPLHRRRYEARHPEKAAAHRAVSKALSLGQITKQPCEKCGASRVEAHHDDYGQPLAVRWLCLPCHNAEHHSFLRSA